MYSKCHFVFLIKWKKKFKILYLDFVVTSLWKMKLKQLTTIFMFNDRSFNAINRFFIFIKKRKTKCSSFFVFHFIEIEKKNYLKRSRLSLWLFSPVWLSRYSRAGSCQVPWAFRLCNGHADTKNPLFRKQLMYFIVYIAGCYCHICFILLIVNCDIKHTSRSNHHEVLS